MEQAATAPASSPQFQNHFFQRKLQRWGLNSLNNLDSASHFSPTKKFLYPRPLSKKLRKPNGCGSLVGGKFPQTPAALGGAPSRQCRRFGNSLSRLFIHLTSMKNLNAAWRSCASGQSHFCPRDVTFVHSRRNPLSTRVCSLPGNSRNFTKTSATLPTKRRSPFSISAIRRIRLPLGIWLSLSAT